MTSKKKTAGKPTVDAYKHDETRLNIPTADAATSFFDEENQALPALLYPRDASLDPQLVWTGKDAQNGEDLAVDAPPIYIQEKIVPRALIEDLRQASSQDKSDTEATLFDVFDGLDELSQVEFYQHEESWKNRMILGDSLQVMGSLAERESLRGKVQMIYLDPPYGIKFGSNWQVRTSKREVRDGRIQDTPREPEQIRAFRDTWELGIHSYLSYLRDRLVVARDLLTESGSIFVQIGDENVHLVRSLLDEVFGADNLVSQIPFVKTSSTGAALLDGINDYLLWFAKDKPKVKYRQLYQPRSEKSTAQGYTWIEEPTGVRRKMTSAELKSDSIEGRRFMTSTLVSTSGGESTNFSYEFDGKEYFPSRGSFWKTNREGMDALANAGRLIGGGSTLSYVRYADDFPVVALNSWWGDTIESTFSVDKIYVVQTYTKVVERCILMSSDPGDLILDPTCGSGTTAFVAEKLGRRWITVDSSRVALALARQRLMGGRYPYYLLADSQAGRQALGLPPTNTSNRIRAGFVYKTVPHVTLRSIANNPEVRTADNIEAAAAAIAKHADFETLYDQPQEDKTRIRVTGPFTFESLSPHRSISFDDLKPPTNQNHGDQDKSFQVSILENLRTAGIQNGRREERLHFADIAPYPGLFIQAVATRKDTDENLGITLGPQYGTVSASFIKQAAKEAVNVGLSTVAVLGFAFDPQLGVQTDEEGTAVVAGIRELGKVRVLIVRMNVDLLMGDELKKTGAGNLFTLFGEPDLDLRREGDKWVVEVRGVDVYDPTSGHIRSNSTNEVALWMVDSNYDGESFFVRHAYFLGDKDPFKSLKTALKTDIDAAAWESLYRSVSVPFETPPTGKIAVKVINDYGDEVMKVLDVN